MHKGPSGVCLASGQQARPTFEVASVKPQLEPFGPANMNRAFPAQVRPGRVFNPTHSSVFMLMLFAYGIQTVQLSGGPDWIREEQFEINATAGRDVTTAETRLMVQSLLEDRFALRTHVRVRPSCPPCCREAVSWCTSVVAAARRPSW